MASEGLPEGLVPTDGERLAGIGGARFGTGAGEGVAHDEAADDTPLMGDPAGRTGACKATLGATFGFGATGLGGGAPPPFWRLRAAMRSLSEVKTGSSSDMLLMVESLFGRVDKAGEIDVTERGCERVVT